MNLYKTLVIVKLRLSRGTSRNSRALAMAAKKDDATNTKMRKLISTEDHGPASKSKFPKLASSKKFKKLDSVGKEKSKASLTGRERRIQAKVRVHKINRIFICWIILIWL